MTLLLPGLLGACGDDSGRDAGTVADEFGTASLVIRRADGTVCELCTYAARNRQQWSQGLMGVTDLDGHDGMIFVFDEPGVHTFWMKDTVMPLSAAWFAPDGAFVAAFDMDPCTPDTTRCPSFGPPDVVTHVLEVPQGDFERLGIGDGSVLQSVGAPCAPA